MGPEVVVLPPGTFGSLAARRMAVEIRRVLQKRGRCTLALSGGETPRPVYQRLVAELPERDVWSRVEIYFADERCVPPHDPASNYRLVRETLLDLLPVVPMQVHRMEGERPDRDAAARGYEAILPEQLDILVLGLGPDGHIASLFPRSPSLTESQRRVLAVTAPKPPPDRLTITPPVIRAARLTIGLVSGEEKAEALAQVLDGPDDAELTPGRLARDGLWIVDPAAAARLTARR